MIIPSTWTRSEQQLRVVDETEDRVDFTTVDGGLVLNTTSSDGEEQVDIKLDLDDTHALRDFLNRHFPETPEV